MLPGLFLLVFVDFFSECFLRLGLSPVDIRIQEAVTIKVTVAAVILTGFALFVYPFLELLLVPHERLHLRDELLALRSDDLHLSDLRIRVQELNEIIFARLFSWDEVIAEALLDILHSLL